MRRLVLIGVSFATLLGFTFTKLTATTGGMAKVSQAIRLDSNDTQKAWVFFTSKATPLNGIDAPVTEEYWKKLENLGAEVRAVSRWFNAASVNATGDQIREISNLPFVFRVEPIYGSEKTYEKASPVTISRTRNFMKVARTELDYGPSKDQAEQIGVTALHQKGLSGKGLTVALLDVGFKWTHEAFAVHRNEGRLKAQWDFVMKDNNTERDPNNSNDFEDDHGTMTWSVLGGYAPGRVVGPAYKATFLLGRTEDARSETPAEEDYWIAGLEWAIANGANIVSSSLGYRKFDNSQDTHPYSALDGKTLLISKAANIAAQKNVLILNSMGNDGPAPKTIIAPADAFGVMSIGAVSKAGGLAFFSSRGPAADGRIKPDVVARGVRNYMATDSGYGQADGTSFSCPLTAGAAALVWEAHPNWTASQVRKAITYTASQAEKPDNNMGYGLVNVAKAVEYTGAAAPLVASVR